MQTQPRPVNMYTFPAPSGGWVKNARLHDAPPHTAEVLDDIFPTATGARLRSGKSKHATITGSLEAMFVYRSGSQESLFAASDSAVYDVTSPADPDVSPTAEFSGLSGGDWSAAQFANASGEYVVLANGTDAVRHYNGTTWATPSITGVTSSDLSFVFSHKERLFFIEKDTLSFWYLPVNSIAGAASEFPVRGVFNLGGSLLFGASWSQDTGGGLEEWAVFVTTEGEVALYGGTDPSAPTDWALQGLYRVGRPLGKNSWYRTGGDLFIMTEDGITPLSLAIKGDMTSLQAGSVSYAIEDAWRDVVAGRSSTYKFSGELWHTKSLLLIGVPSDDDGSAVAFVANARTGAWCRYRGWKVDGAAILDDNLYFGTSGTSSSIVYLAEATGNDEGSAIEGRWVPKFQDGDGRQKAMIHSRVRGRGPVEYNVSISGASDYVVKKYPTPAPTTEEGVSAWGTAVWGTSKWGDSGSNVRTSRWKTVRGVGAALAPVVVVASNRVSNNDFELIAVDVLYETGNAL